MADVVVALRGPIEEGSDTDAQITSSPGGAAANQAVWLARAGCRVAQLGTVGADPLGAACRRALEAEGVDARHLAVAAAPTGTVVALVDSAGQRSMLTDRAANLEAPERAVAALRDLLDDRTHLHVSGYWLLDARTRGAARHALELAAAAGATRSVDASSAAPLHAAGPEAFLGWVAGCDLLCCNLDEARVLAGAGDPGALAARLTATAAEVVVTAGVVGAVAARADGEHAAIGAIASSVVDTVGAGDALCATYLAARLQGSSMADALERGAEAAARAVEARGARAWGAYSGE